MNFFKKFSKLIFIFLFASIFIFFIVGFDFIMNSSPTTGIVVVLLIGLVWFSFDLFRELKNRKKKG